MKGLLIKDMRILLRQKTTLFVILAVGIFMSLNGGNASFSLGYMMVVSATLVVTTIAYDYFEKGMIFMFTLPVSRKAYVLEKYLLALLIELTVAGVAMLINVVGRCFGAGSPWDIFAVTGVACLAAAMLIIALYIPIYIKCGPEKSRVAILIVFGIIGVITYASAQIKAVRTLLEQLVKTLDSMSVTQIVSIGVVIIVLIMVSSIGITIRIMEKKEF